MSTEFEILLVTFPGLESELCAEASALGFRSPSPIVGGVTVRGGWSEVWRANLMLRGASKVLVRIANFRVQHLAQLDKRAHRVAWHAFLRRDLPIRVEASCKGSRIYHEGAAKQRVADAITATLGAPISADEAAVTVKVRIHNDVCTISIDTSGEGLHKRGHKEAVNKAPLRETLAALFLRHCGYTGTETVLDPMCGSGTIAIEAAEIAAGLAPGRGRSFAFELLRPFDSDAWDALRSAATPQQSITAPQPTPRIHGSDRDPGAIRMSRANAERAGVSDWIAFEEKSVSDLTPPSGAPGLILVNPPYGARLGDSKQVMPLYRTFGHVVRERFAGWRVGLITSEARLAQATGLTFSQTSPVVSHGGLGITCYQTPRLGSQ